jgi:hypothetical protein
MISGEETTKERRHKVSTLRKRSLLRALIRQASTLEDRGGDADQRNGDSLRRIPTLPSLRKDRFGVHPGSALPREPSLAAPDRSHRRYLTTLTIDELVEQRRMLLGLRFSFLEAFYNSQRNLWGGPWGDDLSSGYDLYRQRLIMHRTYSLLIRWLDVVREIASRPEEARGEIGIEPHRILSCDVALMPPAPLPEAVCIPFALPSREGRQADIGRLHAVLISYLGASTAGDVLCAARRCANLRSLRREVPEECPPAALDAALQYEYFRLVDLLDGGFEAEQPFVAQLDQLAGLQGIG